MTFDSTVSAQVRHDSPASVRNWLAVAAVATATFAMVTVEAMPVGLLTPLGHTFGVSAGAVALTVTLPGLVASVAAPVLPIAIGQLDRRLVLLGLLGLMLAATVVSASAPDFGILLAARAVVGVAIGGFWALAASCAIRLVPPHHIPRATSLAFGGATVANVLGVPAATLIGNSSSWRVAFLVVAGFGAVVTVALGALLPRLPAETAVSLRELLRQLRIPAVRAGVIATFLLVGAHWAAFTFIRPALQDLSGLSGAAIGPAQLGFGVAGVLGTFVGGSAAARDPRRALVWAATLLTAALALFRIVGTTPVGGIAILLVWGVAFGAIPVGVQSWILRAAPGNAEAATALNTSLYNLAVALGALIGGIVVDATSVSGVLIAGAAFAAAAVAAVMLGGRSR
ncbi:MFS transporter [Nocardia stercoris]|uniref:MFS transporter n=1 Tax=Nocardia stercoris TaxID=2483361 RepID=A0A3M2KXE6_9NOCA|nr:MFS transporter [Nocardia stercoris]RMI28903.1 MFS transporter [Nocardia stercoris]